MSLDDLVVICLRYKCLKPKSISKILENWQKMAYHIDQRSIRCWVKSKLQSALKLQCFLVLS